MKLPNDETTVVLSAARRKTRRVFLLASLFALAACFISLLLGRYIIDPITVGKVILAKVFPLEQDWPGAVNRVIFQIRLPRIVLGALIGAGLAVSGASFQGMFKNPLVSPEILGVTAGAVLVRASAFCWRKFLLFRRFLGSLPFWQSAWPTPSAGVGRTTPTLVLVLSGIVTGAIFSALISLTKYVADPNQQLPAIVFWLMGSLATASQRDVLMAAPPMLLGMAGLMLVRWRINLLALGDDQASSMGMNTELMKGVIIICATIVCAAAVSVAGIIGWVGLVVPHVGRMLVGPDHRRLLPISALIGAGYLVIIDLVARAATPAEIPLGILTSIIGAPFFAVLLRRTRGAWS